MLTYAIPRVPAILNVQLGFQICDSKLFDYLSYVGQSQSEPLCRADVVLAFIIQNNSIT